MPNLVPQPTLKSDGDPVYCLIKICVKSCDMNSSLGSVVPLAMFYYWSANPFRLLLPKTQDCFWMYASNALERPSCLCFPEVRVEIINFRFITIHSPPTDRTQTVVSDEHT